MMLRINSFICRNLVKQSNLDIRNISFLGHLRPRSVLLDKSKHKIIYEFPYISLFSYYIRTKFWVPALMTAIAPFGLFFEEARFTVLGGVVASWLHSAVVHQASKLAKCTIGKIYINKENESGDIIISSIDTSGNRIDRSHKPSDLVTCDFSSKLSHSAGFIKIYVNNTDLMYQLNVITCKVYNEKSFTSLFGSRWNFKKQNEMKNS